jgi:hypothetical protein
MEDLYKIALQDIEDTGEDFTVLAFKKKYQLETGFYKKPIAFFFWLYKKENNKAKESVFKKSFIGRMVKFNKNHIPNYTELVFEYEKEKFHKKRFTTASKKNKLKKLSKAGKIQEHES